MKTVLQATNFKLGTDEEERGMSRTGRNRYERTCVALVRTMAFEGKKLAERFVTQQ